MIDEEWLQSLRFESFNGIKVTGLVAVGSRKVTLRAEQPDGTQIVLQAEKNALGFHIKEIPAFLAPTPLYDARRLNEKLAQLVGRNGFDSMVADYDRLHSRIVSSLHSDGVRQAMTNALRAGIDEEYRFFLRTPGIRQRLEDWATMRRENRDDMDWVMRVNGPDFPIGSDRASLVGWAQQTLQEIDRLPESPFRPDLLPHNPLYVWGGAVLEEFFIGDEIPQAVAFMESRFGSIPSHEHAYEFTSQCGAILTLLSTYQKDAEVERLGQFYAAAGVLIARRR